MKRQRRASTARPRGDPGLAAVTGRPLIPIIRGLARLVNVAGDAAGAGDRKPLQSQFLSRPPVARFLSDQTPRQAAGGAEGCGTPLPRPDGAGRMTDEAAGGRAARLGSRTRTLTTKGLYSRH
jgi:hypothetical protein